MQQRRGGKANGVRWWTLALALATLAAPPASAEDRRMLRPDREHFRPDVLLVKLRPGVAARLAEGVLRSYRATSVTSFPSPRRLVSGSPMALWRKVTLASGVDVEEARSRLARDPAVERAELDYRVSIDAIPGDPGFSALWGLDNTGQTGGAPDADVDAPEAWDITTGDASVVVAVIDTGVDYGHPDLAANLWTNPGEVPSNGLDDDSNGFVDDVHGYDFYNRDGDPFDDHGHGTHVAGTIAAVGDNGVGVAGVAWSARIMAVKFLGASGYGSTSDAISAVLYAANMGARVMNNSWGGGGYTQALRDAIWTADLAGALFVAAAGNSGSDNDAYANYPSGYDVANVLAVAATDHDDAMALFSSYGATSVDLGAPGVAIHSTVPPVGSSCCSDASGYKDLSGTSMATPHASGAAALVLSRFPQAATDVVRERLLGSVDPVASLVGLTVTGGRLNAAKALEDDTVPPGSVTDLGIADVRSRKATLTWTATGDDGMSGRASGYDLRYSTSPMDETTFASARRVPGLPRPAPPGSVESFTVSGLAPETTYHFALKVRDNVSQGGGLSNAATAATLGVRGAFVDDMSVRGGPQWRVWGTNGVGGPALWHRSRHRVNTPSFAFYYGQEGGRRPSLTYNTGGRNWGTLTSPPVTLAGLSGAWLSFHHFLEKEASSYYDRATVSVSANGGVTWDTVHVAAQTFGRMVEVGLDLSEYDGQTVRVRFEFDTIDKYGNSYEGWVVDDVVVTVDDVEPKGRTARR